MTTPPKTVLVVAGIKNSGAGKSTLLDRLGLDVRHQGGGYCGLYEALEKSGRRLVTVSPYGSSIANGVVRVSGMLCGDREFTKTLNGVLVPEISSRLTTGEDYDMVCHSGGGIVGLSVAHRLKKLEEPLRVRKIVLVETPIPKNLQKVGDAKVSMVGFSNGFVRWGKPIMDGWKAGKVFPGNHSTGMGGEEFLAYLVDYLNEET